MAKLMPVLTVKPLHRELLEAKRGLVSTKILNAETPGNALGLERGDECADQRIEFGA